jgi:hypothetical protein
MLARTDLGRVYRDLRYLRVPQIRAQWLRGERQRIFTAHYNQNHWLADSTKSGPGSTLSDTDSLRRELPRFLREHRIRSLLDVPCGDWSWMRLVDLDVDVYIGVDIVPELIDGLTKTHGNPSRLFLNLDALRDELPRAEAILCRDLLIHLPNATCKRLLTRFQRSGATWLLTTTAAGVSENRDIVDGQYRPVNLNIQPFNLPPAYATIDEGLGGAPASVGRCLGVWRLHDLPSY